MPMTDLRYTLIPLLKFVKWVLDGALAMKIVSSVSY